MAHLDSDLSMEKWAERKQNTVCPVVVSDKPAYIRYHGHLTNSASQGFNARMSAGWVDEDHMGLLKKWSRRVSSRNFSFGVLKMGGFRLLALKHRISGLNSQAKHRRQWASEQKKIDPQVGNKFDFFSKDGSWNLSTLAAIIRQCYKTSARRNSACYKTSANVLFRPTFPKDLLFEVLRLLGNSNNNNDI